MSNFIVYKRNGNVVTPHQATLTRTAKGWRDGKPEGVTISVTVGAPVPWAELYAGHTTWVADRIEATRQAIKSERARRAARKGLERTDAAGTPVEVTNAA